jgi:hypothetical protein
VAQASNRRAEMTRRRSRGGRRNCGRTLGYGRRVWRRAGEEEGGNDKGSGLGGIGARMGAPLIKVLERQGMRTRLAMNASGVGREGRIDGRWRPLCDGDGPAYATTRCCLLLLRPA